MPGWLTEDPTVVYMLLATAAIVLGALAYRKRKWKFGAAAALLALLIPGVALLSSLVVTDQEQIVENLQTMARRGVQRDLNGVMAFISSDFQTGTMNRAAFRDRCQAALGRYNVHDVVLWDFVSQETSREKRTASMSFHIKIRGDWRGDAAFYRCEADFVLEQDNIWRMKGFQLFNPLVETKQPIGLPF